jgi:hypothetical protein
MTMVKPKIAYSTPDYLHDNSPTPAQVMRTTLLNRISWGAVSAGVVITFSVQLVLNLLGAGVGFASLDSVSGPGVSGYEFSWASALWWTIAGIAASFAGGFAAGRLAGEPKYTTSAWHGLVTWATSVLVIAVLMSTAAGAAVNMNSPFYIIMDQETAAYSRSGDSAQLQPANPPPSQLVAPDGSTVPSPGATPANTPIVVDADDIAGAALASAIALILGALAAWFGGYAGTVRTPREDVIVTPAR